MTMVMLARVSVCFLAEVVAAAADESLPVAARIGLVAVESVVAVAVAAPTTFGFVPFFVDATASAAVAPFQLRLGFAVVSVVLVLAAVAPNARILHCGVDAFLSARMGPHCYFFC